MHLLHVFIFPALDHTRVRLYLARQTTYEISRDSKLICDILVGSERNDASVHNINSFLGTEIIQASLLTVCADRRFDILDSAILLSKELFLSHIVHALDTDGCELFKIN